MSATGVKNGVGTLLLLAGLLVALAMTAAVVAFFIWMVSMIPADYAVFQTKMSARSDAKEMTEGYARAVSGSALVLSRGEGWPDRAYPGLKLSTDVRAVAPGRVSFDIVAVADDANACSGAIGGGREGISTLRIGDVVLPPPAVQPYKSGRATVDPATYLCDGHAYPLVLRFSHEVAVRDGAATAR